VDANPVSLETVTSAHRRKFLFASVLILVAAWGLRLPPLLRDALHSDEALYGFWGLLIGRGADSMLASVPVYKPPLLPYAVAASQGLLGNRPDAIRFPGLASGMLIVALTAALARHLYKDWATAVGAMAVVALSPLAILTSASAFTDPLMVAAGMAACVAAARGWAGAAGVFAGLSFAAKQTGLVFLPLGLALVWPRGRQPWLTLARGTGGFLCVLGVVFGWDAIRVARGADSFWTLGIAGYGGLRPVWLWEVWPRLAAWSGVAKEAFSPSVVSAAAMVSCLLLLFRASFRCPLALSSYHDLLLIVFCASYGLIHWLFAFPVWDRYLLPVLSALALLVSRVAAITCLEIRRRLRWTAVPFSYTFTGLLLMTCLLLVAAPGSVGHSRVSDGRSAYEGIGAVSRFLSSAPSGSVVYQHWLGWHYSYYLFDKYVYVAYWPTVDWLQEDVRAFGQASQRYIVFPDWQSSTRIRRALDDIGYKLTPAFRSLRRDGSVSFRIYEMLPLRAGT
jgi:4-amino-4-deoxy-L-arabinose transferase-like glycosyltransferase